MGAKSIQKVACIGSGVIGTAWALNFAWKGYPVYIYDVSEAQLENAKENLERSLKAMNFNQLVTVEEVEAIKKRIRYTTIIEKALDGVQFIQESGPENYEIKKKILEQIETYAAEDAIISTSTSGLLITKLAIYLRHPERLIGGHPYNPPHLIPLVEIVKGEHSSDSAAKDAYDFYKGLGKEPVILNKEVTGFISNRLQVAVLREIIDLVVNGVCSLEDADKALLWGPGIRWGIMGPNLILHLGAGNAGLRTLMEKQQESIELRLSDMAVWTKIPETYFGLAETGIQEEISHLPEKMGHTIKDLVQYRDSMLIDLLRLHGKL